VLGAEAIERAIVQLPEDPEIRGWLKKIVTG